jgi:hypothetical protein|eukprot:COSAG01_NODE_2659_length_7299_cov_34.861111_12_plen_97_part_00
MSRLFLSRNIEDGNGRAGIDACCGDTLCTSWAVATSTGSATCRPNTVCCWLKNGTVAAEKQPGTREQAAGYKPPGPGAIVNPGGQSWWSILVVNLS